MDTLSCWATLHLAFRYRESGVYATLSRQSLHWPVSCFVHPAASYTLPRLDLIVHLFVDGPCPAQKTLPLLDLIPDSCALASCCWCVLVVFGRQTFEFDLRCREAIQI
jgi:hypothetical protein